MGRRRDVVARVRAWEARLAHVGKLLTKAAPSDGVDDLLSDFLRVDSVVRQASSLVRGPFPRLREAVRLLDGPVIEVAQTGEETLEPVPLEYRTLDEAFAAMEADYRRGRGLPLAPAKSRPIAPAKSRPIAGVPRAVRPGSARSPVSYFRERRADAGLAFLSVACLACIALSVVLSVVGAAREAAYREVPKTVMEAMGPRSAVSVTAGRSMPGGGHVVADTTSGSGSLNVEVTTDGGRGPDAGTATAGTYVVTGMASGSSVWFATPSHAQATSVASGTAYTCAVPPTAAWAASGGTGFPASVTVTSSTSSSGVYAVQGQQYCALSAH